jgi:uncharacterized damage-inducible protein DinB
MDYKPRLKAQLERARETSEKMLASFKTPKDWTHQVHPSANHAMWFAGHMASADNFFVGILAPDKAITMPPGWKEMFGMGSKPSPNPNDYPPPEEVLRVMRDRRKAVLEAFDSVSEGDLSKPLPKGAPDFFKDTGSLFELMVWHEGLHMGQVSIARRALGHGPLMGGGE